MLTASAIILDTSAASSVELRSAIGRPTSVAIRFNSRSAPAVNRWIRWSAVTITTGAPMLAETAFRSSFSRASSVFRSRSSSLTVVSYPRYPSNGYGAWVINPPAAAKT
ncbi:hypothetical protein BH23GEM2_BH23GEM2_22620 [soil metagenome]